MSAFQGPYLHFSLIATGFLAFCLYFLLKRLREMFNQFRRKWNPPAPFQPELLHQAKVGATIWSFFAILGVLLVAFAWYLSHYQYLSTKVDRSGRRGNASRRSGQFFKLQR